MEARNTLPSSITATVEMNVPVEWEFNNIGEFKVRAKVKKTKRFIKKLARLCSKFGYQAEIEIRGSEEDKKSAK